MPAHAEVTYVRMPNASQLDASNPAAWEQITCGHCGTRVSAAVVAFINMEVNVRWLRCTADGCGLGLVAVDSSLYPSGLPLRNIDGLPSEVRDAYNEARRCFSVEAYTGSELLCRKILMHVAVEKGATEGADFSSYLKYLADAGYITPPMEPWVALIREHGNRSTHDIAPPERNRAASTLSFTEQMLRSIYEMAYLANKFAPDA